MEDGLVPSLSPGAGGGRPTQCAAASLRSIREAEETRAVEDEPGEREREEEAQRLPRVRWVRRREETVRGGERGIDYLALGEPVCV